MTSSFHHSIPLTDILISFDHGQESAVQSTRQLLQQQLPPEASPQLHLLQGCHSQLQALVGSNVAKLVAFNLGYLPGGDKGIVTSAASTVAAVEAALEVRALRPTVCS
jgi:hypothetical protein